MYGIGESVRGTVRAWSYAKPDERPFLADVVRRPVVCEGVRLSGERRETWRVMAVTKQDARKTAEWHFYRSDVVDIREET